MSNGWSEDEAFATWLREALHRPAPEAAPAGDVERIMARVRGAASRRRASRRLVLGAALTAAMAVSGAAVGLGSARALWRSSLPAPLAASATLIGDSILSTLHDTLDLVRFTLRVRGASRVVLAGDFNGWSRSATPLARAADDRWQAVVALGRPAERYAFLVDDTRWVHAPRVAGRRPPARVPASRSTRDST